MTRLGMRRTLKRGFGGIAPWRRELENANVADVARQIRALGLSDSAVDMDVSTKSVLATEKLHREV